MGSAGRPTVEIESSLDPSKVILISTHSEDDLAGLVSATAATAFLSNSGCRCRPSGRSWVNMASPAPESVILRPRLAPTGRPAVPIGCTESNSCQPVWRMVADHDDARLSRRHARGVGPTKHR